jgi:hypothetical protein
MSVSPVAWVPDDDPERDWSLAAELAATWVDDRCEKEGSSCVLVTNTLDHLGVPELDHFGRRHTRIRRAARGRVGTGIGPVLSYVPYPEDLEFAMRLARGSSLAVVETTSFPLYGWAAWLEAWNLVTDEPTRPLQDLIRGVVDHLVFCGNKGFADDFGKQRAQSILTELDREVLKQRELLLGAILAAGVSARGITKLGRLMDKLL